MRGHRIGTAGLLLTMLLPGAGARPALGSIAPGPPSNAREGVSHDRRWLAEVTLLPQTDSNPTPITKEDPAGDAASSGEDGPPSPAARRRALRLFAAIVPLDSPTPSATPTIFPLLEKELPAEVLVSDDGERLVLLGYQRALSQPNDEDAVVLYRSDGTRVRSLRFSDLLTPGDLREAAGFGWGHSHPWSGAEIDSSRGVLRLYLDRNLPEETPEEEKRATVEIDLDTGVPLLPKRDLLTQPRSRLIDGPDGITYPESWAADDDRDCSSSWIATLAAEHRRSIPTASLRAQALEAPLPLYSELGRKARVTGTVTVEVRIAESGAVEGACVVKRLPMALDRNALEAAKRWRFRPFEAGGQPAPALGRLTFEFGWFLAEAAPGAP